jgi:chitodextrinase
MVWGPMRAVGGAVVAPSRRTRLRAVVVFVAALLVVLPPLVSTGATAAAAATQGPALLQADGVDAGHVELAWTPVAGASQYSVYRDGSAIVSVNTLRTTDTAIAPGSSHNYRVTATVGGSETGPSPTVNVTVPALLDTQAPTAPTNLHTTAVGSTSATIAWSKSSDDVGVIGYFVKLGGVLYSYTEGSLTTKIPYLKANTTYGFDVSALDASGKFSAPAHVVVTTAALGAVDTTPPGAPSLTATAYSATEVDLSWSLPGDADLTGFLVYQGNVLLEDIPPNSSAQTRVFPVSGLSPQTSYTFSVRSYDAAGNQSSAAPKTVTTLAANDVRVARGPYVQRVDAVSARVVWRTNIAAPSQLSYSDGVNNYTVQDPALRTDHSVLIGPLPSLARITYTLNYPTPKSGNFETCSGTPATLNLDAVGDMGGSGTPVKNIANQVAGDHPDLIAAMGDDVYPTGLDKDYPARFFVPYASAIAGSAFFTTFGNHEYYSPGAADAHRAWSQPGNESYYSFDCSGVHITVLDNYQPYGPGSTQYQWLANDLATTTQPWKIVVMHIPPYSSSTSGPYPGSAGVLATLFESNHVQLVLSGHSHNYERTIPLNGVTYMVDGGGGNGLNTFSGSPPSWSAYRAAEYSYLRLAITPSQLAGTQVRQDGTTGDTFTIPGATASPIDTAIDSSPATQSNSAQATFSFHATQSPATYQCQLDAAAAAPCTSPVTYSGLAEGSHSFSVAATAASGTDPSPATATWTVDLTAPSPPSALVATAPTSAAVNLTWAAATDANGIAGYDITRNGAALASVSGSATSYGDTTVTANTAYTYQVVARDAAGNVSAPSNLATCTTPGASIGGPVLVQVAGSTTNTVTPSTPTRAGDLLVLSAGLYTGTTNRITSVTDSAGNAWIRIGAFASSGHNSDGEMWYAPNAGTASTIVVNTNSAVPMAIEVLEFSGVAIISPLDVSTGASTTGTLPNSGSAAPTATNDLVVGFIAGHANGQAITVTAPGYTTQPQQTTSGTGITSVVTGYAVLTDASAQAFTGNLATAMYWAAGFATFRSAS